jgi:hypothetical protein
MTLPSAARAKTLAILLIAVSPALAGCKTDGPSARASAEEAQRPHTRHEVAFQCWASVDKAHKTMTLDQRADVVTKCIDDKMKGAPPKG